MNTAYIKNATIMAIDDEAVNLKLLDRLLKTAGYINIHLFQDSREVLSAFEETRPDIMLLDINMPHVDGFHILEQLQHLNEPPRTPVLVLTAQDDRSRKLKALDLGARDFVGKPFDRDELLMRVRNLLEAHLATKLIQDQKAVLEDMVQLRTQELYQSRLGVVQRLGKAAEYKDEETGYHILRVSHTSTILAREAGWNDDEIDLLFNAAPMHDIGKIGIPDSILLKPGKLDPDEWEIMKEHTLIGGELLEGDDSSLMKMAREIALSHHEKWDGSGYPYGISGENIPQSGRLVAIADVFDALTSVRPYKKPWSLEDALDLIKSNRAIHFDPDLVDLFFKNLDDILDVRSRYL